jgi:hypothetical protein
MNKNIKDFVYLGQKIMNEPIADWCAEEEKQIDCIIVRSGEYELVIQIEEVCKQPQPATN